MNRATKIVNSTNYEDQDEDFNGPRPFFVFGYKGGLSDMCESIL